MKELWLGREGGHFFVRVDPDDAYPLYLKFAKEGKYRDG